MRVVFTGQTGIEKDKVVANLRQNILNKYSLGESDLRLKTYPVEKMIFKRHSYFIKWLKLQNERTQTERWQNGFDEVIDKINQDASPDAFICMHNLYFRNGRFLAPVEWQQLRELKPDIFITLIDDIYDIWWRLRQRKDEAGSSGALRLREILAWRSLEILTVDTIARNLFKNEIPHYVIATKHPVTMLAKLLSEPKTMKVYASYPIGETRKSPEGRKEIDIHRKRLHELFVVFDPVSIDEFTLKISLDNWKQTESASNLGINFDRRVRWDVPSLDCDLLTLSNGVEYPAIIEDIDPTQVEEIVEALRGGDVNKQIVHRDFRLVDQCECLAAFRPNYKNSLRGGVSAEIDYALQKPDIHSFVYYSEDDGNSTLFHEPNGITNATTNYEKFISFLMEHQELLQNETIDDPVLPQLKLSMDIEQKFK